MLKIARVESPKKDEITILSNEFLEVSPSRSNTSPLTCLIIALLSSFDILPTQLRLGNFLIIL